MSCEICGRNSCTRSFHSLDEQERYDLRQEMSDDVDILREELQDVQGELKQLEQENERLGQELEVLRKLLSDEIYCFDYCKNFMEKESKLTRYCARGSDCKFEWNGRKLKGDE